MPKNEVHRKRKTPNRQHLIGQNISKLNVHGLTKVAKQAQLLTEATELEYSLRFQAFLEKRNLHNIFTFSKVDISSINDLELLFCTVQVADRDEYDPCLNTLETQQKYINTIAEIIPEAQQIQWDDSRNILTFGIPPWILKDRRKSQGIGTETIAEYRTILAKLLSMVIDIETKRKLY